MLQLYDFIAMALISEGEKHASMRAVQEVLAVMFMFAIRLVVIIPIHITLTLAEAAFLSADIETVVPSPTKERGLTIGELIGEKKPSTGLEAFTGVLKPFGTAKYLWLIELHLKKCFVQIVLEVVIIFTILVSIM